MHARDGATAGLTVAAVLVAIGGLGAGWELLLYIGGPLALVGAMALVAGALRGSP